MWQHYEFNEDVGIQRREVFTAKLRGEAMEKTLLSSKNCVYLTLDFLSLFSIKGNTTVNS